MIPKKYRFTTRVGSEFFTKAKRIYSPFFILYFQKKEKKNLSNSIDNNLAEAAIIVSKKYAQKATERNKIKRKISEALFPLLSFLNGFKMVFFLKRKIEENDLVNFDQEIKTITKKVI